MSPRHGTVIRVKTGVSVAVRVSYSDEHWYEGPMTDVKAASSSLYERLGGEMVLMEAVDVFYSKIMADSVTRPFFEDLDMAAQTRKQLAFMARAFGGPKEYEGRDLRSAHAKLVREKGLSDVHFDAVAGHLEATLRELEVAEGLISEALTIVASTRAEVLGR